MLGPLTSKHWTFATKAYTLNIKTLNLSCDTQVNRAESLTEQVIVTCDV